MRPDEIDAQTLGFFQNLIKHRPIQEVADIIRSHVKIVTPRTWEQVARGVSG